MKSSKLMFSSNWHGWPTPKDLFQKLNNAYKFDTDLAADATNNLCPFYFTAEQNALLQNWTGFRGFCNPPYKYGKEFIEKCIAENDNAKLVCILLPARTDTRWFHKLPEGTWIFLFKGRLRFGMLEKNSPAPFPSLLAFFGTDRHLAKALGETYLKDQGKWVLV